MDRKLKPEEVALPEFEDIQTGEFVVAELRNFVAYLDGQLAIKTHSTTGAAVGTREYSDWRYKTSVARYNEALKAHLAGQKLEQLKRTLATVAPDNPFHVVISDIKRNWHSAADAIVHLNDATGKLVLRGEKLEEENARLREKIIDLENELDKEKRRR